MKKFFITATLLLLPISAWADCVQFSDPNLAPGDDDESGAGVAAVKWKADFQNTCEDLVDLTLWVNLKDVDGETIYTLIAMESFDRQERREIEKQARVPQPVAADAVGVEIEIVQ